MQSDALEIKDGFIFERPPVKTADKTADPTPTEPEGPVDLAEVFLNQQITLKPNDVTPLETLLNNVVNRMKHHTDRE